MAIRETPTNIKTYYKLMHERVIKALDESKNAKTELEAQAFNLNNSIKALAENYKTYFDFDVFKYEEFVNNKHTTGQFYKAAKGLFMNRNNNYELVADLYKIYDYASKLKKIHELDNQREHLNKLAKIGFREYNDMLKIYYEEVHRQLILKGNGYAFEGNIGWICVNRIVLHRPKKMVDYIATRKREAELKSEGKRIWNKDEADWCARNGIEYKAEDKRVFRNDEYCYEIPLMGCTLSNGYKYRLEISNYRNKAIRHLTNDQLIEICNNDTSKICNLSIDLKAKLTLCDKADKTIYTKYIRNENQKSVTATKARRKNRQ